MKHKAVRFTAKVMLCVMTYQLVIPVTKVMALTSGPSQPEVQSFEPVGTTDMVDVFSGDFVYNIPLLDVDGYPVNISYHSGITMEQEASWVGLGWNINPGEINRGVRGVPDDFKGDVINKRLNIKPEKDYRLRLGANVGFELFGALNLGVSAGQFISYNNYKGVGIGMDVGAGLSVPAVGANVGVGMSVGSLEGADVSAYAGLTFSTSKSESGNSGSISFTGSTGFNTRSGLKDIGVGVNVGIKHFEHSERKNGAIVTDRGGIGFGSSIPIGLQNYVPVQTNATMVSAWSVQVKFGIEAMFTFPHFNTTLSKSQLEHEPDGARAAYGYLYAQDADKYAMMDFSREKDGIYNSTLPNLPLSSMTYDIYSISGQGTGGMFRPFRNDIGTVFDPETASSSSNKSVNMEFGVGIGPVGGLFEFGTDVTIASSRTASGPWIQKAFRSNSIQSFFENVYFKQAGEMTYSQQQNALAIAEHNPVYYSADQQLRRKGGAIASQTPNVYGTLNNRTPRANHLSYLTNREAAIKDVTFNTRLESYPHMSFVDNNAGIAYIDRSGTARNKAKSHHVGEMTQVLPDGRRYVYGLPAMNNLQKEATFSVKEQNAKIESGLVKFTATEESTGNISGRDNYYQATYTPAYAHSYLLTSVLSPDFMDITGDGITEDDLGNYTKFNYSRMDADYRWIAPIHADTMAAQYNPGFWSDPGDDKGNYVVGSKEMWYLHTIETKNCVAEFYTSERFDGRGVKKAIGTDQGDNSYSTTKSQDSKSYKLDSIRLFNKHDRILKGHDGVPIKTVIFDYDYSLCKMVPNNVHNYTGATATDDKNKGKLTLKRIYFRYGNSNKSLLNPYIFKYDEANNRPYNFSQKDRWGNFKLTDPSITSYEFPYVKQGDKLQSDGNASSWHLNQIELPSGGTIKVNYEADDYSYVQDKRTMEMFKITGVGNSVDYVPKDILYENVDQIYNYVYFLRDRNREENGKSMRDNYLQDTDQLYFSFNVDIAARNKYEHIKGYAKVEDIDSCTGNTNYGYIKLKKESAGLKSGKQINPVTLAGLNTGRYYLPHIIYPGYKDDEPGDMEVLNGLVAATKEMMTIFQNANVRFVKNGLSRKINIPKSWVRLHTPGHTKIGGGTRVRELTLEDSWDQMAPNGSEAIYGRRYDYTTLKDNKTKISSGVASYEPMIGADEIPQRSPVKYTADAGRLMPSIEFYQEEPLGESFYPSPSVGYSKVTVTSINRDIGRSAKAEDVFEFYTAKDFPVATSFTEKNTPVAIKNKTLTNRSEELEVVQGYLLTLNDMHGKTRSTTNYAIKQNSGGASFRELITSTRYNYQTDASGKLYNKVKAVKRGELVSPTYTVADLTLGEEVDFTIDSRRREMESQSINVSFNLNVVNFLIVVVPVPTVFFPDQNESSSFKTMVATKVIQQYGILKSVEVIDHGARTMTENQLYDSETGQVLLTRTNNEFNDPVTSLNYPAYWAYDNMGSSYFNTGYEEVVDSMYVDQYGKGFLMDLVNHRHFNQGDELLIGMKVNNVDKNYRVWVTGMAIPTPPPGTTTPVSFVPCNSSFVTTIEPRAVFPNGNGTTPWVGLQTGYKNVSIKVLRSGRRNQLSETVQNMSVLGTVSVNSWTDMLNAGVFNTGTLNAAANTFTEIATNKEFTNDAGYGLNPYIRGQIGNFRQESSYTVNVPRNYAINHARKDGTYTSYVPFWQMGMLPVDATTCSFKDYIIKIADVQQGWRKMKTVTEYNSYGLPIEEQDAAGIYSTAVYGYNNSLPVAVAANAKSRSVKYYGFEDALQVVHVNNSVLGIWGQLYPVLTPSTTRYRQGQVYNVPNPLGFGTNLVVTNEASHTGNYAMKTVNASGKLKLGALSDFSGTDHCYISIWVKPVSGPLATGSIVLNATGVNADNLPISQSYTAFAQKTNAIDGWYKLEGKVDLTVLTAYKDIHLMLPSGYLFDDVRIYPDKANMKSFAYNVDNNRLMAELDENNFATLYEYDPEGVLIRVKKETERGILTVNEHRKANAKRSN